MSSLSCGICVFHCHWVMPRVSLDPPPVKMLSEKVLGVPTGSCAYPGAPKSPLVSVAVKAVWKTSLQLTIVEPEPAPRDVYSHTSPGSSRWLSFRSPLTYTGEKSSAVVAVPLSSTSDVIVSGVLLGLVTRYVQTTGVPAESGRGSCMSSASSTAVGASGLAALTAFLRMTPWVVPTWYAGSRAKTVPAELVAETVA